MATTYEIFCERCGTRHVEKPAPVARGGRLRGLLRNAPTSRTDATTGKAFEDQSFLRVCLACRGYTCANCWNDESGYCLDCAPAEAVIDEQPSTDVAALTQPLPSTGGDAALDQFADTATPTGSDWPAADLAGLWNRPLIQESSEEPAATDAQAQDSPFEPSASDDHDQLTAFESPTESLHVEAEAPQIADLAQEAEDAGEVPDSDLLSDGDHVPDLPLFELSAILAQFSDESPEAPVEHEPPVEMPAEVEMSAAVDAEPVVEMPIELDLEPPAEMIIPVEAEPVVETPAEPEMAAAVEAEPVVETLDPAPIRIPAPPPADVIWPPAGPAGLPPETPAAPAIQPMLAFEPDSPRRRPAPTSASARRPVPRNMALMSATVPQIRDCANCQLPISVRARFCRRCGTSQVNA